MPNNKILTAGNAALTVTNLAASPSPGTATMEGVPLGTGSGTGTGEIGVKTINIGTTTPGLAYPYNSAPQLVTASGSIPSGVLGWSFTVISGTVTINGSGTLPIGASFSGGGYLAYTLDDPVVYTITAGSALVTYDTP